MNIIDSIILGIIQGITEFLPISSSGHLAVLHQILGYKIQEETQLAFDVILHFGTFFALFILFFSEWKDILYNFKTQIRKKDSLLYSLLMGMLPVLLLGVFIDKIIGNFYNINIIAILFFLTGSLFIIAELYPKIKSKNKVGVKDALIIGIFQIFTLLPGISRSGTTISAGLLCKVDRYKSAKFSFMMSAPLILIATLYTILKIYIQNISMPPVEIIIIGFIASFISSFFIAKFALHIFKKVPLYIFSIYLILLSIFLLVYEFIL